MKNGSRNNKIDNTLFTHSIHYSIKTLNNFDPLELLFGFICWNINMTTIFIFWAICTFYGLYLIVSIFLWHVRVHNTTFRQIPFSWLNYTIWKALLVFSDCTYSIKTLFFLPTPLLGIPSEIALWVLSFARSFLPDHPRPPPTSKQQTWNNNRFLSLFCLSPASTTFPPVSSPVQLLWLSCERNTTCHLRCT